MSKNDKQQDIWNGPCKSAMNLLVRKFCSR